MEKLIELINKNIQKSRSKGCGWSYTIDLKHSCISSDTYNIYNASLTGEGNTDDLVKVVVNYYVHSLSQLKSRFKMFRGIEKAIQYIWAFPEQYLLCLDCCNLYKKDSECDDCLFYKTYMSLYKKKESCGICQEETFRTILSCKHHFHKACLLKLDPENLRCPLCRHPMDENIVVDLFENEDDDETENIYVSDTDECM